MNRLLSATVLLSLLGGFSFSHAEPKLSSLKTDSEKKNAKSKIIKNMSLQTGEDESSLFESAKGHQTTMTFDGAVAIKGMAINKPSRQKMLQKIEEQLTHLFGPMSEASIPAVPKADHSVSITGEPKHSKNGWVVKYSYQGTVLVGDSPSKTYDISLPVNPDTIYKAGYSASAGKNLCTDDHYNSEGDFWYFWNPKRPGCPLVKGKDYVVIKANLEKHKNSSEVSPTKKTYPEYDKMVRTDASGNEMILISILMGMDEPDRSDRNPHKSRDINAGNYRDIFEDLTRPERQSGLGFVAGKPWSDEQIKTVVRTTQLPASDSLGWVEELTKSYRRPSGKSLTVTIRMFFGASGINENSTSFHYFFKEALESHSAMVYDGHSGLGGHLDLESIESTERFTIAFNPNLYQIYFFNSCSSFTYYNNMYFDRKTGPQDPKGTKSLDILNNGLATLFNVMQDTNLAVVKAIDGWLRGVAPSYQDLAKTIDSNNLFAVNGDEDNSTEPPPSR